SARSLRARAMDRGHGGGLRVRSRDAACARASTFDVLQDRLWSHRRIHRTPRDRRLRRPPAVATRASARADGGPSTTRDICAAAATASADAGGPVIPQYGEVPGVAFVSSHDARTDVRAARLGRWRARARRGSARDVRPSAVFLLL